MGPPGNSRSATVWIKFGDFGIPAIVLPRRDTLTVSYLCQVRGVDKRCTTSTIENPTKSNFLRISHD
jgi:hypothetical protein